MPASIRITKTKYAKTAFDGEGAKQNGGRWNSSGTSVVYTAGSESLAILELLVHLQSSSNLDLYSTIPASFDDALIETIDAKDLPSNWRESPAPSALQEIGDRWANEQRSVALKVPSSIVPNEYNYLLNPQHADFEQVQIGEARKAGIDKRLTK